MAKRRYDVIRQMIKEEQECEQLIIEHGNADKINEWRRVYVRRIRDRLKKIDSEFPDPLAKSLTEDWRGHIDKEYGESGYHYRIFKSADPDDWTDEDIEEYIMSEVGYGRINSPYDCTGRRFTRWCSWSKTPAGIVMIHAWGLDV